MSTQTLTYRQGRLLQALHDGELGDAERAEAHELLERSAAARVWMGVLEELGAAVEVAEEVIWERAREDAPSPAEWAREAALAPKLLDEELAQLAPMLERVHDGEATELEVALVAGLRGERADVDDYLTSLDELSLGVRALEGDLGADVDFGGFWAGVAEAIHEEHAEADGQGFDPAEHLVLLQRFFDDEVDAQERSRVAAWIDEGQPDVIAYLDALEEVRLATNVSVEWAREGIDLTPLWTAVAEGIADGDAVVSLDEARAERAAGSPTPGSNGWFDAYRQAMFGAAAAVLLVAAGVGIFQDDLFGPREKVVVKETVVIVDSVTYSPGSDVLVDSPIRPASLQTAPQDEAAPTVIWLFDSDEEEEPAAREPSSVEDDPEPDVEGDENLGGGEMGRPM